MFYIMCHLQVLLKVLISHLLKRKVNSQEEWLQEIILIDCLAMLNKGEKYRKENH